MVTPPCLYNHIPAEATADGGDCGRRGTERLGKSFETKYWRCLAKEDAWIGKLVKEREEETGRVEENIRKEEK